jgi:hypothetical protein
MSKSRGGIDISGLQALSSRTPRSARDVADKKARAELRAAGDAGASKKGGAEREDDLAEYYRKRNAEKQEQAKLAKQKQLLENPTQRSADSRTLNRATSVRLTQLEGKLTSRCLICCVRSVPLSTPRSLIDCACSAASRSSDLAFLVSKDVDLDDVLPESGRTALMAACQFGSQEGVEALVRAGADVDLQNAAGVTALMVAVSAGHASIVSFLLDHSGASPHLLDRSGHSALQCAYERGHAAIASKLVRALALPPPRVTTIAKEKLAEGRLRAEEARKKEQADKKALLERTIKEMKEEETKK